MPIGKNSLKRVSNNGYSKVNTSAPDMENSEISLVAAAAEVTEERLRPKTEKKPSENKESSKKTDSKKAAPKKAVAKKTPAAPKKAASAAKRSTAQKAESPVEQPTSVSLDASEKRCGEGYVNLGGSLPYYLL